jgi:hypothetical protein
LCFPSLPHLMPNLCLHEWCTPKLLDRFHCESKGETTKRKRDEVCSLAHSTSGVKGRVGALGWGLWQVTKRLIIHTNLHKPNNKLVNVWLEHFWCTNKPWAYTDSQDSPQPGLGGSHHLPLYSIIYVWPWGLHPNVILSRLVTLFEIGTSGTLEAHNFCANIQLRWGPKKSYSPCWELSNDMWNVTCTQVNQGDFWLLMIGSQIGNLTFGFSFGHNLCFKCSNGMYEPILDIYVPRAFQWCKKTFQSKEFWPFQSLFKNLGIDWDSNSQSGSPLGSVWV